MMSKSVCALACTVAAMLAISGTSPAFSQSTPKQKQAQDSTGEANSQKQLGGQKRDRHISHEMLRNSQNRMVRHSHVRHGQVQY